MVKSYKTRVIRDDDESIERIILSRPGAYVIKENCNNHVDDPDYVANKLVWNKDNVDNEMRFVVNRNNIEGQFFRIYQEQQLIDAILGGSFLNNEELYALLNDCGIKANGYFLLYLITNIKEGKISLTEITHLHYGKANNYSLTIADGVNCSRAFMNADGTSQYSLQKQVGSSRYEVLINEDYYGDVVDKQTNMYNLYGDSVVPENEAMFRKLNGFYRPIKEQFIKRTPFVKSLIKKSLLPEENNNL